MSGSLLDGLLAERDRLVAAKETTIPFPDWPAGKLALRVRPIAWDQSQRIRSIIDQAGSKQRAAAELKAEASVVAAATVRVVIGGDRELSLKDLGEQLGLPEGFDAADVILELRITDGAVFALSSAVAELSGFKNQQNLLDEEFAGESAATPL